MLKLIRKWAEYNFRLILRSGATANLRLGVRSFNRKLKVRRTSRGAPNYIAPTSKDGLRNRLTARAVDVWSCEHAIDGTASKIYVSM
jgi:hypothetical protein